jgi:hypothetical protein
MKTKTFRTCEVTKDDSIYALCHLKYSNDKYIVIVKENSDDLFIDFSLEINNNELPEIAIKFFEVECLDRFTCFRQFTLEEVKENSGEEISFY